MKEDLPYFSHDNDARNHAKMKALRARYGWTGYGQFWALNEMIAGAAYARLDLSRKVVKAGAACELGMTPDALEDFLKFLSDYEECGLIHYENGIITTDRTQENYEKVEADRLRKRGMGVSSAEKRKNSAEESRNGVEESNKLNETKLKEKKINKEGRDDSKTDYSKQFDSFYEEYPKHEGKKQAYKAYCSVARKGTSHETIMERLETYKSKIKSARTELQYVRMPSTFLNNIEDYEGEEESDDADSHIKVTPISPEVRAILDRYYARKGKAVEIES
jgi:hypothetical protein